MNNNQDNVKDLDNEIDLKMLVAQLWQGRAIVLSAVVAGGAIALAISLSIRPVYTASASILPPQQQASGLSAALGSLGAMAGVAAGGALKNPNDLYVAMMKSQTVSDRLIAQFDLKARYEEEKLSLARKALDAVVVITSAKSGLIEINVDDHDPQFAARLANAYVVELKRLNQNLAVTDAAKRRMFFEKQLQEVKQNLAKAELGLESLQKKTGLVLPEGQVGMVLKTVTELKAKIAAKEVEIVAMRSFATEKNPDFVRAQEMLAAMKRQLAALDDSGGEGSLSVGAKSLPQDGLAYIRAVREVKYNEALLELMAKQYEFARVEEGRDSSMIQVLDVATAPDQKSKPKRSLIVMSGVLLGLMLGVLTVFIRPFVAKLRAN
ncbi:Wzz/FepE/Etk N-terminal domain-containing protein [Vogesella sp. XCS3]|uniref:GumC family protein n=1 Tax=Vogesella sp. XCS3 TaxID=2877939 RepID=UPI001D09A0C2|nr:Wzz/FepE/Etk N-terminal domain-containing protein [Vogesella sp. XCS3]UDM17441.1 hypothetical protein LCH97_01845 [Vogesella sp. XCS3]